MDVQSLTLELSDALALPEPELIRKGLLALIEKEIRLAELERNPVGGVGDRPDP
jgi:hypothetical protein